MPRQRMFRVLAGLVVFLTLCCGFASEAQASAGGPQADTAMCETCHATPGLEVKYPTGEVRTATVDPAEYAASVHGGELQCTACHQGLSNWPHLEPGSVGQGPRDVAVLLRSEAACGECHRAEYQAYLGSRHARALVEGNTDSAVCSDCHGSHNIQEADSDKTGLALGPAVQSCAKCHEEQYQQYAGSVHGRPMLTQGDINVPVCVDCHGTHDMPLAKSADFRRQSPYTCANCHADEKLMDRYDLSTEVFNTYVADFHGASAHLLGTARGSAPEQATCYDCHGVHDIAAPEDPASQVISANIQKTCQECHEDAGTNFPAAWLGHSEASPTQHAPVFWTNRFFTLLTVSVMIGLIAHIFLDVLRVALNKLKKGQPS